MTALALDRSRRRGACPGLSAPLPTGDGLLVRLMSISTIPLGAFTDLCAAARQHGNGVIEVTARGNIQVRGLTAASAPRFAAAIAALDIAAADGIPVIANALAGLDAEEILDASVYAADLRRSLATTSLAARLSPKLSVVIDGGGAPSLDGVAADVRFRALTIDGGVALGVAVGGDDAHAASLGVIAPACAVEAALRLVEVVARHGREARARDILATEGMEPFRAALRDLPLSPGLPRRNGNERTTDPIGRHKLRDGSLAYGVGLPFGHADAATLECLAEAACTGGAIGMHAATSRALMIIGLTQETASAFAAAAEHLGFIVRAGDPRCRVVACAGAPICSSAHIAARAIAPLVANIAAPHLRGSRQIHISGCAKSCAHAGKAALTIVGRPDGCAIIADGSVRDQPVVIVGPQELPAAIADLARNATSGDDHV
jgi:precorrin-3B synthase